MNQTIYAPIDAKMESKGYERVSGMAILNDIIATETPLIILNAILITPKAVEEFNNEVFDGWVLYRKRA